MNIPDPIILPTIMATPLAKVIFRLFSYFHYIQYQKLYHKVQHTYLNRYFRLVFFLIISFRSRFRFLSTFSRASHPPDQSLARINAGRDGVGILLTAVVMLLHTQRASSLDRAGMETDAELKKKGSRRGCKETVTICNWGIIFLRPPHGRVI